MKKTTFLLVLIFGLIINLYGQNFYSFPNSNSVWNIKGDNSFSSAEYRIRFGMMGDTIIGSNSYHKVLNLYDSTLTHPQSTYNSAIREENKRIYVKFENYSEQLLYDFNLTIGDSIQYFFSGWVNNTGVYMTPDTFYRYIAQIDTIQLHDGSHRKHYVLNPDYIHCWHSDEWIEGIGSIYHTGLFNPFITQIPLNGDGYWLSCFKQNDTVIYLNNPDCEKCFCYLYTQMNNIDRKKDIVIAYPNPFSEHITFLFLTSTSTPHNLDIWDIHGKLINTQQNITNSKIMFDGQNLKSGIYYYKLTNSKEVINMGKIIKN